MTQTMQALRIGQKARTLLQSAARQWSVHAAVSGAVYISNRNGELLWITDRIRALHTRAVLLPAIPRHAPATESVLRNDGGLLSCGGLKMDWRDALLWTPGRASTNDRLLAGFAGRVTRAMEQAEKPRPAVARLGRAVAHATGAIRNDGIAGAIRLATARGVETLSRAFVGSAVLPTLRAASGLVGLGEGLTPTGDDILGGYLYTLRTLDDALGGRLGINWPGVAEWLHGVSAYTNDISHCVLADHASGDACAPLSAFLRETLGGSSEPRLALLAADVIEIGASSGWSLLVGVRCASRMARTPGGSSRPRDGRQAAVSEGRPQRREVAHVR